uniref:lipase family protein n=1 Tax=Collinsella sp. BA40 TaxID=2560852 RepID=UPI002102C037|nr:lipase family protein [Collinsella sp. BA40]
MIDVRGMRRLTWTGIRRAIAVVLVLLGTAAASGSAVLGIRHGQELRGAGAVDSPAIPDTAYAGELPRVGRFETDVTYSCYGMAGNGEVSSHMLWDDAWFDGDPRVYNHDLARASSVLAALAYAESGFYQSGSKTPPYMENVLHQLGFDMVETGSYRFRSEVVDEVLDVMTQQSDGVAYGLARKELMPAPDGTPRELIAVSVRGSYGSEWLSNFNLGAGEAAAAAEALADERSHDHTGYQVAALEILGELDAWVDEADARGAEVSVLLTGHSRGGAVAGLLAAMLDDRAAAGTGEDARTEADAAAQAPMQRAPRVFAYTFASPRTTLNARGNDARYGNIFNIVNPADLVTNLPLESWGYVRYGVDVPLPSLDDEGFGERFAAMQDAFEHLTGGRDSYDAEAETAIDGVVAELARTVPTAGALMTPRGVASVAAACALRINPTRILRGHYPSVYIAWMESLPGLAVDAGRPA